MEKNIIMFEKNGERILIEPWGLNAIRVRTSRNNSFSDKLSALLPQNENIAFLENNESSVFLVNGKLKTELTREGVIRHYNSVNGKPLLMESDKHVEFPTIFPSAREYKSLHSSLYHIKQKFESMNDEKIFGLGQHQHGMLNQKGCVVDLVQKNTEVSIPFIISDQGYGFLWNNPAIGRVELAYNFTRWEAETTEQIDYLVIAGDSYEEIMESYCQATGFPSQMPDWALGLWQSKLRYKNQNELLEIAIEYKKRNLPLSVIVIDFFHWKHMGDWSLDPIDWPDPKAMVRELEEMGIKVMISVWPTLSPHSENYKIMNEKGLLVQNERGIPLHMEFIDSEPKGPVFITYYDSTRPEARDFIWNNVKNNYYKNGIKIWWLDSCEPDIFPSDHDNIKYYLGNGKEVGCIFPLLHQKAFYDGMRSEGEKEIILISRSAWAGSQRYGAAVWSGDIRSSFESLRLQVTAGLNMAMSGIPWWNTDIGGFHSGYPETDYFRELIVRWFQYALFTPVFRLHGCRLPFDKSCESGCPNEVWSFGDKAYMIIQKYMSIREKLKPYMKDNFKKCSVKGIPVMRPLFFDYSFDKRCYEIDDEFLFGNNILVAPVLEEKCIKRNIYLPDGLKWYSVWTGIEYDGGNNIEVETPIEIIPIFTNDKKMVDFFK